MRLAVSLLGLDLFTLELTTDTAADVCDDPGDCTTYPVSTGFCLPERDGGTPELVD